MFINHGLSNTSTIKSKYNLSIMTFYVYYNIFCTYLLITINFYNPFILFIGVTFIEFILLSDNVMVDVSLWIYG